MFGKLKSMAIKKMLKSQMKDVPEEQQQMILELVEKDPQLFEQIAKEIQAEMKANGNNQMAAAMKILPKFQDKLMAAMSPEMREQLMKMQGSPTAGKFNPDGSLR